jgi:hypothetical protein
MNAGIINTAAVIVTVLCLTYSPGWAEKDTLQQPHTATVLIDSNEASSPLLQDGDEQAVAKSSEVSAPHDTAVEVHKPKATSESVESPEASQSESVKKIPLTRRSYDYRRQVILAVGMMAFIAIVMTTSQSLNPK